MMRVNHLSGCALSVVSLACVSIALGTGCYINDEAMCHWFWVDDDQCPDDPIPGSDVPPIEAAFGAPEGVDETVLDTCELTVRHNFWLGDPFNRCSGLLPPMIEAAVFEYAEGEECP